MRTTSDQLKLKQDDFDTDGADLFNLKGFGETLSFLLTSSNEQQVIALDGDWGEGKTHFLKLWTTQHNKTHSESKVIYLDAFFIDLVSDPLTGLLLAVEKEKESELSDAKRKIEKLAALAPRLALPVGRTLANIFTMGSGEHLTELVDIVSGESENLTEAIWDQEKSRINNLETLKDLMADISEETHIIFAIDELDRCRPDFALEFLEVVQHLFKCKNIHFLFGVNQTALAAMVHARYGSTINANRYLHKFFKSSLSLPKSNSSENIKTFLEKEIERAGHSKSPLHEACLKVLRSRTFSSRTTYRDIEQIVSKCHLKKDLVPQDQRLHTYAFFLVLGTLNRDQYNQAIFRTVQREDFELVFEELLTYTSGPSYRNTGSENLLKQAIFFLFEGETYKHAEEIVHYFPNSALSSSASFSQHIISMTA